MKLILRFRHAFWPEDCQGVISSHTIVPEFWMNDNRSEINEGEEVVYTITGFAMDAYARKLQDHSKARMLELFLEQLDLIFGTETNTTPASAAFDGQAFLGDWSLVPFIEGGYR